MKLILLTAVALGLALPALAHSLPKSSTPAAGSTLPAAPAEVVIMFSEPLEPRFSSLQVKDADGNRVDDGPAHTAPGDATRFSVGLKPLPPGTYKVIWHATSVDTHKTEGSYDFTVGH
jgi:methionine-rich copper-binding protein CopC